MSVRSDMGCEQARNNTDDPVASHECARYRVCVETGDGEEGSMNVRWRMHNEKETTTTTMLLLRRTALQMTKQHNNDTRDDREDAV